MVQLEKRFYSREELAAIAGLDIHGHNFSGAMKNTLTNWGYGYDFLPRRGFQITKIPETALERMTEIMRRELHINTQVDPWGFANFVMALMYCEIFDAMPWDSRVVFMEENFDIKVSARTLQSWRNKLCDAGVAHETKKGALWHTFEDENGNKIQEEADPNSEIYKVYCAKRSDLLEKLKKTVAKNEVWGTMVHSLYDEYGVYYYCKTIDLLAWGIINNDVFDIIRELYPNRTRKTVYWN